MSNGDKGHWEFAGRSGVLGTHAVLLNTGSILLFTRPELPNHRWSDLDGGFAGDLATRCTVTGQCGPDESLSAVLIPNSDGTFLPVPADVVHNAFCAGQTLLADGRVLVAGGDKKWHPKSLQAPRGTEGGLSALRVYDPAQGQNGWETIGRISCARWYPTCTLLPDGRVFVVSGSTDDQQPYTNQNPTCELVPPLPGGAQYLPMLADAWPFHSYPPAFVLPDGRLALFARDTVYFLTLVRAATGIERFEVESGPSLEGEPAKLYPNAASAALLPLLPKQDYAPEMLLVGGGGGDHYPQWEQPPFHDLSARRTAFRLKLDPEGAVQGWEDAGEMEKPRVMPDSVLLPDGTVLVVNGVAAGFGGGDPGSGAAAPRHAVREPEIYDPAARKWTTMAPAVHARLYHSTALLLPDATVLVAGSDQQVQGGDSLVRAGSYCFELERFVPPYIRADRPVIRRAPGLLRYGQTFELEVDGLDGSDLENVRAALLYPGAVTHSTNMSQRHVGLKVADLSGSRLTLEAPPNSRIAPPGWSMLFVLRSGIPSIAAWVQLPLQSEEEGRAARPQGAPAIWLRSDHGVVTDATGAVQSWLDRSGNGHVMIARRPPEQERTPPIELLRHQAGGHPALRFSVLVGYKDWNTTFGCWLASNRNWPHIGDRHYQAFVVATPWPPGHLLWRDRVDPPDPAAPGAGWAKGGRGDLIGWGDFERRGGNAYVGLRLGPGPCQKDHLNPRQPVGDIPVERGSASVYSYWRHEWQYGGASPWRGDQDDNPVSELFRLSGTLLFETRFDGQTVSVRVNDRIVKSNGDQNKNTMPGPLCIGRNGEKGAYYRGDIHEVLVYDGVLGEAERQQTVEYLRTRYDLW